MLQTGLAASSTPVVREVDAAGFPATLTIAEGAGPLAVIVAGSGPTDRDGNNNFGVTANYLAKLAQALAPRGISSLRYDKRGVPGSVVVEDEEALAFGTFADDLDLVLDWARNTNSERPLILIGHSEGGLLALKAAGRRDDIAALVLLATPGRPLSAVLRDQFERLPQPERAEAETILVKLERKERVEEMNPFLLPLFRPSVQPYLMSQIAFDPAAALAALTLPVLVLGGGTDLQVGRSDLAALAAARLNVEAHWFAKMNHVLTDAPAETVANIATYAEAERPLSDGLADAMATFIRRLCHR